MSVYAIIPLVSFILLLAIITGRVIFLKQNGVLVISKRKKNKVSSFNLFPVFLFFMMLWIFEITKPVFQIPFSVLPGFLTNLFYKSSILNIVGGIIILLALILLVLSLLHFKTSLRFGLHESNQGKLVTTGVFSISRNPFFLSLDLYFSGIALIYPNLFFIGFSVLAIVSIHFYILKEERFLRKMYGDEYSDYTLRAGRYF